MLAAVALAAAVGLAGREVMSWEPFVRVVLPAGWLAVWTAATVGIGRPIVSTVLGPRDPLRSSLLAAAAAGAAAYSLAATLLALAGFLRPAALVVLLAVGLVTAVVQVLRSPSTSTAPALLSPPPVLLLPALCGVAVTLLLTTPPVMYDVANYHLAFPQHWLAAGGFVEHPRHAFSYYPSAHGMCWSYALATVGPWGASALHAWFGGLAAVAVARLAGALGGRRTAAWAVSCFVLTPALLEVAAYASADLVLAGFGACALLLVADSEGRLRRTLLAGVLVGTAVAAKYLAAGTVALPLAAAVLAVAAPRGRRHALAALTVLTLAAAAVAAPWLARNVAWTGNPVYPYLQPLLGGPPTGFSIAAELRQNLGGGADRVPWIVDAVTALARRTFGHLGQGGWIGLHWLILLPTAVAVRLPRSPVRRSLWAAAVVSILGWGALVQFGRFLLPGLAFAAPLAGAAAAALTAPPGRLRRTAAAVLLGSILTANATVLGTRLNIDRLAVTAGLLPDEAFTARWLDYAPLLGDIERSVPPDGAVLLVAEARSLYIERRVLVEDPYREPLLLEMARDAGNAAELATALAARGITHLLVNTGDMDRQAALRGADGYLDDAGVRERALLDAFASRHLETVAEAGPVRLARLRR